jgi:hypothetical protein
MAVNAQNLYILVDLCMLVIQGRCHVNGWPLESVSTSVKFPADLFDKLASSEATEVYLLLYYRQCKGKEPKEDLFARGIRL